MPRDQDRPASPSFKFFCSILPQQSWEFGIKIVGVQLTPYPPKPPHENGHHHLWQAPANSLWCHNQSGWTMIKLADTVQRKRTLMVGQGPGGHMFKMGLEMEGGREHVGVLEMEQDALLITRKNKQKKKNTESSPRANMPRKVVCMCPAAEASRKNLDTYLTTGWRLVVFPKAGIPRKSQEASITDRAPGA